MPSLPYFQAKLNQRTITIEASFRRLSATRTGMKKSDRFAHQEGLISALWQSWCSFCRSTIIWSLKGTQSSSGLAITSSIAHHSLDEICFAAMKASKNQTVGAIRPITGDHLEPTWGDLRKINTMLMGTMPTNQSQLLTAFGAAGLVSDLQIVRNACAHISNDRITDIRGLQVRYSNNSFFHPSDSAFWIEPQSTNFLWSAWIVEMRAVAGLAVL
jgi:hypothetical protein